MTPQALDNVAAAHHHELGHRVAFMLHGSGENSAEERVRLAAVRGWGVQAVGYDPTEGQMSLELAS